MEMSCSRVKSEEVAMGYLLGTLDEDAQEAYEQHVFDCPGCLDDLETLRVLQHELEATREKIESTAAPRRLRPTSAWVLRFAAVAAVIWAAVLVVGSLKGPEQTQVVSAELAELARIEPAPYTQVTLRGATGDATDAFQQAMDYYLESDHGTAADGLQTAFELDPQAPKIGFYLGVSLLLGGETDAGIEALRQTIALGDTLYLEIAQFYLSKAYLLKGDVGAARTELLKTRDLRGDLESEAERLLSLLPALDD